MSDITEIWKAVPGLEGRYEVSSHGRVRSLRHVTWRSDKLRDAPKMMRVNTAPDYHQVELAGRTFLVHRLVLEAFVGPCPDGCEGAHRNGDKSQNALSNLRWATPKENAADRLNHGTLARGESQGLAKLTEADVRDIRASPLPHRVLAELYDVSRSSMWSVVSRATWKHI